MESLEVLDPVLPEKSRRRRYSAGERASYIRKYESSGLKQRVYAEREGLEYTTFLGWLRKHRREDRVTHGQVRFAELTVGSLGSPGKGQPASAVLEVCLPDGVILRGSDAVTLSQLYHGVLRKS